MSTALSRRVIGIFPRPGTASVWKRISFFPGYFRPLLMGKRTPVSLLAHIRLTMAVSGVRTPGVKLHVQFALAVDRDFGHRLTLFCKVMAERPYGRVFHRADDDMAFFRISGKGPIEPRRCRFPVPPAREDDFSRPGSRRAATCSRAFVTFSATCPPKEWAARRVSRKNSLK